MAKWLQAGFPTHFSFSTLPPTAHPTPSPNTPFYLFISLFFLYKSLSFLPLSNAPSFIHRLSPLFYRENWSNIPLSSFLLLGKQWMVVTVLLCLAVFMVFAMRFTQKDFTFGERACVGPAQYYGHCMLCSNSLTSLSLSHILIFNTSVPWLEYPIIYDIRSKPHRITSPTGTKGKRSIMVPWKRASPVKRTMKKEPKKKKKKRK